jgi:hypothetical protein
MSVAGHAELRALKLVLAQDADGIGFVGALFQYAGELVELPPQDYAARRARLGPAFSEFTAEEEHQVRIRTVCRLAPGGVAELQVVRR